MADNIEKATKILKTTVLRETDYMLEGIYNNGPLKHPDYFVCNNFSVLVNELLWIYRDGIQ